MQRSTKIVATIGPASSDQKTIDQLVAAGVDVVRLNFSHGTLEDHQKRIDLLQKAMRTQGSTVAVMADLQGPKIRVGKFAGSKIMLKPGQQFILDAACKLGDSGRVGLDYPELVDDVAPGDTLLLDDGRVVMDVEHVEESEIHCVVRHGTELSNNKGINKQGGGLSAPALTAKDMEDIKTAAALQVDYVAVSFPKSGGDLRLARKLLHKAGSHALVVAKIERCEAIDNLEDIMQACDGVMVARGDLAVEVGDAAVPALQKKIIRMARAHNKFAITATQMMESMIHSPVPTRAEVSDVANAVLDGTDAVMLSAETAAGKYPAKVVEAMDRVCREAEKQSEVRRSDHRLHSVFGRIDEAIAMATMYTANHLGVAAIAALTESGATPKWMSRISSGIPIYALTPHVATRRKVTLFRGVYPISFDLRGTDTVRANREVVEELLRRGAIRNDDLVIITKGDFDGREGATNVMKIVRVGDQQPD